MRKGFFVFFLDVSSYPLSGLRFPIHTDFIEKRTIFGFLETNNTIFGSTRNQGAARCCTHERSLLPWKR